MAHQAQSAPLLQILFYSFFCKTTNGAPPAGAPLVTRVTNGAFDCGAPLVTWDPNKIFWTAHTYPLTFPTSFHPPPSPSFRPSPPPHLISTIDSTKLSGEITFF